MSGTPKAVLSKLRKKSFDDDIFSSAAQVAFYFSFAIFPLLLFLVTLFGIILGGSHSFKEDLFFYLGNLMPKAAYELVQSTILEVSANSSGGKLTLGLFVALWSASAGIDSLRVSLNRVYDFTESRSWWKTKILSIASTLVLSLLITVALASVFYGWKLVFILLSYINLPISSPFILVGLQWLITLFLLLVIFEIVFNVLPNRKPFRWFWITPGASVAIVLWLLLSFGLKTYLQYFNSYDRTYGSIGAVIILMLWLYLTALVILVGGMINAILEEIRRGRAKAVDGAVGEESQQPA